MKQTLLALGFAMLAASGASVAEGAIAAAFTNDYGVIEFNDKGGVARVLSRSTGHDLAVRNYSPAATFVVNASNRWSVAKTLKRRGDRLVFTYGDTGWDGKKVGCREGEVELSVRVEKWGFVFRVEKTTLKDDAPIKHFVWLTIQAANGLSYGKMMNCASNDDDAMCLRAYDVKSRMWLPCAGTLSVNVEDGSSPVGQVAALAVGARGEILKLVREMTLDFAKTANGYWSKVGGAWALEAEENRRSYIFAYTSAKTVDEWIALAERSGVGTYHFDQSVYNWFGRYDPNPVKFPGGDAEFKACVDKAHKAGFAVSSHTLSAGIDFCDPWISPKCNTNLFATYSYTLARPFKTGDTEFYVNELPGPDHAFETSYGSNGNIFRFGTELVTYEGLSREKPYRFTGVKRGAYKTDVIGEVPAGTRVDYVQQRFGLLFPDMRTPFAHEVAKHIADRLSDFGFDMIYHDGIEPYPDQLMDLNRNIFSSAYSQAKKPIQFEASNWNAHGWWYHSEVGALDYPTFCPKAFHDQHLRRSRDFVRCDFLPAQVGWWLLRSMGQRGDRHALDDSEYFAGQNARFDYPMSFEVGGISANGCWDFYKIGAATVIGWYERARLQRALSPEAHALLEKGETALRQEKDGSWRIAPVAWLEHRALTKDFRSWKVKSPHAGKARVIVQSNSGSGAYDDADPYTLLSADAALAARTSTAAKVTLVRTKGADTAHGPSVRLAAANANATSRGAWVEVVAPAPKKKMPNVRDKNRNDVTTYGFWVKGDGSGAVLDFRLVGGGYTADHVLVIDFTGWRFVKFSNRERDTWTYERYKWEGGVLYNGYTNDTHLDSVFNVSLCLNEVPAGGKTEIEVSEVRVLKYEDHPLEKSVLTIGGKKIPVPFKLAISETAELEDGQWTHVNAWGNPIARVPGPQISLAAAETACSLEIPDAAARAYVRIGVTGASVPAYTAALKTDPRMGYEADLPLVYSPAKGFREPAATVARPDQDARLEFAVYAPDGGVRNPVLRFADGREVRIAVTLEKQQRLFVKGRSWTVQKTDGSVAASGTFDAPLPLLKAGTRATLTADADALAWVAFVKRYADVTAAERVAAGQAAAKAGAAATTVRGNWRDLDIGSYRAASATDAEAKTIVESYRKLLVWANPNFESKNSAEARKVVGELMAVKSSLAPILGSKTAANARAATLLTDEIETLAVTIPGRIVAK